MLDVLKMHAYKDILEGIKVQLIIRKHGSTKHNWVTVSIIIRPIIFGMHIMWKQIAAYWQMSTPSSSNMQQEVKIIRIKSSSPQHK